MSQDKVLASCPDAATYGRAKYLLAHGRVRSLPSSPGILVGTVEDGVRCDVRVLLHVGSSEGPVGHCSCSGARARRMLCCHAAALWMDAIAGPIHPEKVYSSEGLLEQFEPPIAKEPTLRLKVSLRADSTPLLSLKVGIKRFYVIHDLQDFMHEYRKGNPIRLGKSLIIDPTAQCFSKESQAVLDLVFEGLELLALHGVSDARLRSLPLTDRQLLSLLERLQDLPFTLLQNEQEIEISSIHVSPPALRFRLNDQEGALTLRVDWPYVCKALDLSCNYVVCNKMVYFLSYEERMALSPFLVPDAPKQYTFQGSQRERLLSDVLPLLRTIATIDIDPSLQEKVIHEPLMPRVTLDLDGGEITCQVLFTYGSLSIDPFAPDVMRGENGLILERDTQLERAILDVLSRHGFRVRSGSTYLSGDDGIYAFLTEGVPALQGTCEVYSSKSLLALRPRRVRPTGRLSMNSGVLEFQLMIDGAPDIDYQSVLGALKDNKEYVRLRDGAFITLQQSDGWNQLASYLEESGDISQDGLLRMEGYRAAYLDALLEHSSLQIERDAQVRGIANALASPIDDEPTLQGLRPYQRRGFSWLCTLAGLNMGGILADDMGLGKTLQILALIDWGRQKHGRQPTLVIAPTTLTYNWMEEVKKFTPHLDALVLSGSAKERHAQAELCGQYDLVIMSYAQARRDAESLKSISFRYVVLDEAQNIKNAASVGAESVKLLKAQARFALTGTPMENHLGELWSLFDFVLPGYLGKQDTFLQRYGDTEQNTSLLMRIRPFLMRRLKRDVLTDLPEKIEHRIVAELTPAQREVYQATLARTREELSGLLHTQGGYEKSRFKVLAAITRLRQICCHPSLYLPGYEGGSGKLELLMELVRDALAGDHRILLFSQFTSMLALIGEEFAKAGIPFFYLDGKIPSLERMTMATRFNAGERPIFLISLRAGGTGLNLTTADTVIHFDPWWNPAVEEQATDRAHRIGQEKVVQVIKLIARDTIEEKVFALKGQKQELIDRIITPGEAMATRLTSQEILSFFD